ncbi:MAG: hypothetical protein WCL32_22725 [Planctomycetota bacterium]
MKQYLGHGGEAEAAAKKIAQQEADRDARRSSYEDEIERNREGERVLIDLRRWLNLLTHATMILKGYCKHNGQYRRRHHVRRSKG